MISSHGRTLNNETPPPRDTSQRSLPHSERTNLVMNNSEISAATPLFTTLPDSREVPRSSCLR